MHHCPACGDEVADGARFCSSCGAAQAAGSGVPSGPWAPPVPAQTSEERRFVTILFVDLVGFTERSDLADPEDVRTTLLPYHGRAKEIIERYGGTLDKFIGDAVMGVFGAPVAHEDDPARAVHAALRILAAIDELRVNDPALQVRVAVNSGEAVVTAGEGPQIGEAVAGDVVNTASRMQSLAPPGGVVIGPVTERLVRGRFETEALPPAMVKGKSEPLRVWRVTGEREAAGDPVAGGGGAAARGGAPPSRGSRHRELELLRERLEQVVRTGRSAVVTVVGDPGIGKSRLVEEFRLRCIPDRADVAGEPAGPTWLEDRCVPYAQVSAFDPVAGILRRAAGITPDDGGAAARAKVLDLAPPGGDGAWAVSRLAPVLGFEPDGDTPGSVRGEVGASGSGDETIPVDQVAEAFAQVLLTRGPVVLTVHDLHWAEDVMLEFLRGLARLARDLPVMILVTARPELFDRPGWPPAEDATTVRLQPLPPQDTERLVRSLLEGAALRTATDASVLERSGGNPLYAVEFARMLMDRSASPSEGAAVPESVRSVIAARLDAIPEELRAVVLLASVAGSESWPALLAALGGTAIEPVRRSLRALADRDIVRPASSTVAGHDAFVFAHDLIREVSYGRIARRRRARLHLQTADWLEAEIGERAEERAETIAGHLERAVEFGRASREDDIVERAGARSVLWLLLAADRAMRVDVAGSGALYERALALGDLAGADLRSRALVGSARAGRRSGALAGTEVLRRYERALEIERGLGDPVRVARVLTRLASQLGALGETVPARAALTEAIALLEREDAPRDLATAYAYRAEDALFAGKVDDALADAERALTVLGNDASESVAVMLLHIRGDARCSRGDRAGLQDLERALQISESAQSADEIVTSQNYLADWLWAYDGPAAAVRHLDAAIELAERRSVVSQGLWAKAESLFLLYESGEGDEIMRRVDQILAVGRERLDSLIWLLAQVHRAKVLLDRGGAADAVGRDGLLSEAAIAEDDLQVLCPVLVAAARLAMADGEAPEAVGHLRRFQDVTRGAAREFRERHLAEAVDVCVAANALDVARELIASSDGDIPQHRCNLLSARAALREAEGDPVGAADLYERAGEAWETFGSPYQAARARQRADRCRSGA